MTLSTPELLRGNFAALSAPPPAESAGDFMAGTIATVALITILAAQEAETAAATRAQENQAIRGIFTEALATNTAGPLAPQLAQLAVTTDTNLAITALDAANAPLRTALIALHAHAESENHQDLQRKILRMLMTTAEARLLSMPAL
jgi:hypothetical protein